MLTSHVQKIARVLNILVLIALVCNLILLFFVPVAVRSDQPGLLLGTGDYLSGVLSVSYTHLDVYKRQIFDLAFHGAGAAKITKALIAEKVPTAGWLNYQRYGTFANIYAHAPEEKSYAWTVSYTHLDVYKRQAQINCSCWVSCK